ncbi:DUF397 domain-containing protein [Streptomyces sp. NBC_01381]|uniref:DUF397 domain-containing protein n=1 Tax=Streptomyces sp. NBC_01381 TaxID=2903845 RepID=UPI00224F092E|nr:DUF397 domain-containing protein [Streptomyces sp. NBC_01381]MCX4670415.1 DUF397 domain-containing protein [Streptomyces sp. NBC_01381]
MPELKWLKSTYSEASGNNCVEVARNGHLVVVRDSKDVERPWATVGHEAWRRFTGALAQSSY